MKRLVDMAILILAIAFPQFCLGAGLQDLWGSTSVQQHIKRSIEQTKQQQKNLTEHMKRQFVGSTRKGLEDYRDWMKPKSPQRPR